MIVVKLQQYININSVASRNLNEQFPNTGLCYQSNEEARILKLLQSFSVQVVPFDRAGKLKSFINIIQQELQTKPGLIVMERSGLAGGIACLCLRWVFKIPYQFSYKILRKSNKSFN